MNMHYRLTPAGQRFMGFLVSAVLHVAVGFFMPVVFFVWVMMFCFSSVVMYVYHSEGRLDRQHWAMYGHDRLNWFLYIFMPWLFLLYVLFMTLWQDIDHPAFIEKIK